MARNSAPGKHYRKGISLKGLFGMFPDNDIAEKWFQEWKWKGAPHCPKCRPANVDMNVRHPAMPHRCRE